MKIRPFEHRAYAVSLAEMRHFSSSRTDATEDEIWLVEHEQVFTLGLGSKPEHLLAPGDIPCVQTERGGQVTYHGPGQLVAYLLLDLRRSRIMVRDLVCRMESAVIETLAVYGLQGVRKAGAPGVYVDLPWSAPSNQRTLESDRTQSRQAKIAALGIKISKGCSYHGLALNVDMDLQPYARINPCGFPGLEVTDIKSCLKEIRSERVLMKYISNKSEQALSEKHCLSGSCFYSQAEPRLADVAETLGGILSKHLTSLRLSSSV